jgi:lactoylglutathione lyase
MMVNNVSETLDFYTNVLGFTKIASVPETGKLSWAMARCGDVTFMFQEKASLKEEYPLLNKSEPGGGITFYISVSGVRELFDKLRSSARIVKEIHKTFYNATEFAIQDNNGYILVFAQNE